MHPVEDIRRSGATLTVEGLNWVRITPTTGSSHQLQRRCWNENHDPAEAESPSPRLSSPGERERKAVIARRVGGSICYSLCSVSNSLSHTTLSIKWEVCFSKELCPLVFIVLNMFLHACVYVKLFMAIQQLHLLASLNKLGAL